MSVNWINNEVINRVGIYQECVEMNERFARDILLECSKEFGNTMNPGALDPISQKNMKEIFSEMLTKVMDKIFDKHGKLSV